jgi:GH25 family lysozyme M1 (1,4-beta-N-acetylmuramidase)
MKKIIDISNNNGDKILCWSKIAKCCDGAIFKATEGTTFKDKYLNIFYDEAKKQEGFEVGVYHFLRTTTPARSQAINFYETIKELDIDIIPVLDIEGQEFEGQAEKWANEFIDEFINLTGLRPMIYTNRYFCESEFSLKFRQENLWWLAEYNPGLKNVAGADVGLWQYTENGLIVGISGKVDINKVISNRIYIENDYEPVKTRLDKTREYEEHGFATVLVDGLRIRRAPNLSGEVCGRYSKGNTFYYDRVIENNGIRWVHYLGNSGNECYVASRRLSDDYRYLKCE